MSRKKQSTARDLPDTWVVSTAFTANGRHLTPGIEIKIRGERGRFRFDRHVHNGNVEWVDVRDQDGRFRSFRVERIKTVHIKQKLRPAA
jgi:hypothetical protein